MKVIILSQGYITVVSSEDFNKVKKHSWHVTRSGGVGRKKGEPYACSRINGKKTYLHRWLMAEPVGMVVDHVNQQTLDNRRENLKVCTHSENLKNRASWKKEHRKK